MTHVFGRSNAILPVALRGEGCYLIDATGKRYLDASGGAAVSCLGHAHPGVRAALHDQLDRLAYAHTSFFTSDPAERLAERLARSTGGVLDRVYLVSGGSEAVEAALKLARQYWVERGEPGRRHIIARRQSYHGNTLGALATGGNAWRRAQFAPMLIDTHHIAPCHAYRDKGGQETPEAYGLRVADELETMIARLGPETVIAFVAEPVVGATLGAVPPVPGYFRRIRDICDRHGILLILDEVMCGMGRTGTLHAHEQDGLRPDILCIAKGLGAGYQPIGAMMCTAAIHDTIAGGSGFFQHGHTYLGHPMAAAAANAVLDALEDGLLARVGSMGAALAAALCDRFADHPHVGDIRGRGLFIGLELVADRASRAAFDPARALHKRIRARAQDNGLLCYPMGGTIDGQRGDHILLAPPYILEDTQIGELTDKLAQSLDQALAD